MPASPTLHHRSLTAHSAATPPRGRSKNVREHILTILAEGPKTRPALLKECGCSPAAMHTHLKALRADGFVVADEANRVLSLKEHAAAPVSTKVVAEVVYAEPERLLHPEDNPDLQSALQRLSTRLSPFANVSEKLKVLNGLAHVAPDPIAVVLRAIADDLSGHTQHS